MTSQRQPLSGRAFWFGTELERSGDWIRHLDTAALAEIDAALAVARRRGGAPAEMRHDDFPLGSNAQQALDQVAEELENGRGMVRLRGIDPARYSLDDLRRIFWGLGLHLGVPVFQNGRGEIIGEVRDETRDANPTYARGAPGQVVSSRARTRSTGSLRFHTDRCDVIALMCASNGIEGGVSKLASAVTVYNEMLRLRPDLLEELCRELWRRRPEDEDLVTAEKVFPLPVFGVRDGKLSTQYSRTYVEQAQEFAEVPRLTQAQIAAMDLWAELAESTCLQSPFVAGDIQLLNNHVIYHGRTAYADDLASGKERRLLRLWLSMPNSRALPAGFERYWGAGAPGVVRGGVVQQDRRRSPLAETGAKVAA
jgi:hypothetical protein